MIRFFSLKMGLAGGAHQSELIQQFKSNGDEVIQTSDGLCLKTKMSQQEIESFLADRKISGVSVSPVEERCTTNLPTDVAAFMGL